MMDDLISRKAAELHIMEAMMIVAPESVGQYVALDSYRAQMATLIRALPAAARIRQLEADLAATLAANAAMTVRLDEAVSEERSRCMRIVSAARNGDIDTDFRTLLHFMESGDTMQFFAETHEYVHDSAVQDRIAVRAFLAGGAA